MANIDKVEEPSVGYGQPLNFEQVWQMFKDTDKKHKETEEMFQKSIQESDKRFKELSRNLGGIGNSNGYYAEQFFADAIDKKMHLIDIELQSSERNKQKYIKDLKIREEYDVILTNTDIQIIVEIKYRFKQENLKTLISRKIPNYRTLFPENKHYKLRVAIAAFSFEKGVIEMAKQLGCYILTRKGEELDILSSEAIKEY
ncbi:MAG: hypothetical protein DRJ05_16505 [Bacteroidetes bacterium]|nr:MAG: hypothetical protein DRJ05_16505 [Bacteroidota bacterium]